MVDFIFGTPILVTKMPDHESVKQAFSEFLDKDKYFKQVDTWNCNVETTFKTDSKDLPWNIFIERVMFAVNEYLEPFELMQQPQFGIHCWLNRYKNGQYQEVHNHLSSNNAISLSYMMELPEDSGDFVFYKEGNDFWHTVGVGELCNENSPALSNNRYTPKVSEGDIIIFPSYLDHYVSHNKKQDVRATISANLQIVK